MICARADVILSPGHLVTLSEVGVCMYNQRSTTPLFSERTTFFIVFGLISLVLLFGSIGIVGWIRGVMNGFAQAPAASPIYTAYSNEPADYLKPESLAAMTKYITEHPQPQNVQVLTGMNTGQIAAYMVGQVAGGLKVDCTYCHNLANGDFSDDVVPAKAKARQMML